MRVLTSLSYFVALILFALPTPATADSSVDSILKQLKANESYSFKLQGQDENGAYHATYLFTLDL